MLSHLSRNWWLFVLRGAMQVGALRALFEAGLKPDLLVGTSIGR